MFLRGGYAFFVKKYPTVKTVEIRQKKAQIRGSSRLYCRKKNFGSSRKLSKCRQISTAKCLRTKTKYRKILPKENQMGFTLEIFIFSWLSKECPIIRSIWSSIRIQHGPVRNMLVVFRFKVSDFQWLISPV